MTKDTIEVAVETIVTTEAVSYEEAIEFIGCKLDACEYAYELPDNLMCVIHHLKEDKALGEVRDVVCKLESLIEKCEADAKFLGNYINFLEKLKEELPETSGESYYFGNKMEVCKREKKANISRVNQCISYLYDFAGEDGEYVIDIPENLELRAHIENSSQIEEEAIALVGEDLFDFYTLFDKNVMNDDEMCRLLWCKERAKKDWEHLYHSKSLRNREDYEDVRITIGAYDEELDELLEKIGDCLAVYEVDETTFKEIKKDCCNNKQYHESDKVNVCIVKGQGKFQVAVISYMYYNDLLTSYDIPKEYIMDEYEYDDRYSDDYLDDEECERLDEEFELD